MEKNQSITTQGADKNPIKSLFSRDDVQSRFREMLGKRSASFITSVLQIAASNDMLKNADPASIYQAATLAATLDLPLNASLGFAYIIPFRDNKSGKTLAQFQIGYKGLKQLALRSGQFVTIHGTDVREGELKKFNRLTGVMDFDWIEDFEERMSKKVIGYVSYFELLNGYSQTFFMTIKELEQHGKKYSQTYKKGFGLWKDDFDGMALKTVTKLNLSKNAPLSIEMQKAVISDQSVIKDAETIDVDYIDNDRTPPEPVNKEHERILLMIQDAQTESELVEIVKHIPEGNVELEAAYNERFQQIEKEVSDAK